MALYETLYVNVIKLDQQRLPRHISLSCCLAVAIQWQLMSDPFCTKIQETARIQPHHLSTIVYEHWPDTPK